MAKKQDINIIIYKAAEDYLNRIRPAEVTDLDKYFLGDARNYNSLKDIYLQFIASAQNYQSMPNIIKFWERKKEISKILHDFDIDYVKALNPEDLYRDFRATFPVGGVDNRRNSWYKWSCSVVDSAKFLLDFSDDAEFEHFVKCFDFNVSTRMALPLLISQKIRGIGFALACDLLKELGFINYPKPDVHLMDVFSELGLSEKTQISTFEAIVRMSDINKPLDSTASPYKVDKVFWLICSGKFYAEKPEVKIDSHKESFIEYCKKLI